MVCTNSTLTELIGIIDVEHWLLHPEGFIDLRFYVIGSSRI
ncbi:MAG: hypothetical protein ACTSP9_06785 [Promethearchaeota archaeon]